MSGESFTDFVKYLLFRGRNFTAEPDRLPCVMIDPDKLGMLQIKNEGLRICDLCPNFPQKRLAHVFIDTLPTETDYNLAFGECYGNCFSRDDCVAFSYDHDNNVCYMFNSTIGTLKSAAEWTTVFMTQPTGILNYWSYVRHTSITGKPQKKTTEPDFVTCLEKCENTHSCKIVSYSMDSKKCDMFDSIESINFVDLKYAHVSAFNIREVPLGKNVFWRFIEDGDILKVSKVKADDKCAEIYKNKTHSAYYSKPCLTNQLTGCDSATGCKRCYYPELLEENLDFPICPDSDFIRKEEVKKNLENEMKSCLKDDTCMGIGYDKSRHVYQDIKINTLIQKYDATYILRYPQLRTGLHQYLDAFEFMPNIQISQIAGSSNQFRTLTVSYQECIENLKNQEIFTKASYSFDLRLCHLGDVKIKYVQTNDKNYITILEKPSVKSHLKNFIRVPNMNVDHTKADYKHDTCQRNCEEECAARCADKCTYVLIKFHSDKTECYFFESADTLPSDLSETSVSLVKTSDMHFTLASLNKVSPFQSYHLYDCFSQENKQTLTSLSTLSSNSTAVSTLRRKRGFWSSIGKAFKKAGEFVVNTVKDTVNTVVDTAKGVVNTVGKAVQGDFEGAKNAFLDIPIVHDVKNVVELGGAVVTGDWDKAKEKGIDLLQSKTLDLALTAVPGGKIAGAAAKAAGKALKGAKEAGKKSLDRVKRNVNKNVDKVETKNKKVKDKKNKEENGKIEERGQCKKRTKRAANKGKGKSSQPGDCDDDDDDEDDTKFCSKPNIVNSIPETLTDCLKKKAGGRCDYECEPGYEEEDPKISCKKLNGKHVWPSDAKCNLKTCGSSPFPLIVIETPQISKLYKPSFGKFVTVYVVLFHKLKKVPIWSVAMQQADALADVALIAKFDSKR